MLVDYFNDSEPYAICFILVILLKSIFTNNSPCFNISLVVNSM